ncbi:WD40 repeat-like protein, partial [Aspergillus uvarum CBS 121591]
MYKLNGWASNGQMIGEENLQNTPQIDDSTYSYMGYFVDVVAFSIIQFNPVSPLPATAHISLGSSFSFKMGWREIFPSRKNRQPQKHQNEQQTSVNQKPKETSNCKTPQIPQISDTPSKNSNVTESATQNTPCQAAKSSTSTLAVNVWNRAYDQLANNENTRALVEAYFKALKKAGKPASYVGAPDADEDISEMKDQAGRDKILQDAIKSGQQKIHKSISATNTVGKVSSFILQFKEVVDLAVGTNPQAALPWAGVCIGLTFLLNPAKASQDNLDGVGYVTSRMKWYCSLTDQLLSREYIETTRDKSFEGILDLLEERVIDLYKELLLFQMKSVCSYYKNQGWVFVRNLIDLDGWDGQLEGVKATEKALQADSKQYHNTEGQKLMREFALNAQATQETLGTFHQTLRDYIAEQWRNHQDGEFGECLRHIFVDDPQRQIATKLNSNDKLLKESYEWILRTEEYQALQDWESATQILWLFGPAGTGKTMLTIGIITQMFQKSSNITASISSYFCGARGENQTRVMDVLRTLIWGLLIQQPHLFSHLREKYKSSGKNLFTAPRTFWYLRDIFLAMLADERLTPVYLAVDALDECERIAKHDEPGVNDLMEIIYDSLQITNSSAKIKWILSSRPEISLPNTLIDEKPETLKQVDVQSNPEPVDAYITYKVSDLKRKLNYSDETLEAIANEIRKRAQNTFLWAALVFKDLIHRDVMEADALEEIEKNPAELSELYENMMVRIENGHHPEFFKSVLEAACFASRPLSYAEIQVLSGLPSKYKPEGFVSKCGSFLTVEDETVHVLHNSAREHLLDYFNSRVSEIHDLMCERSIKALSEGLRFNMYDLLPDTEISHASVPQNKPLDRLAYSCEYWTEILRKGTSKLTEDGPASAFLKVHFLHWLESLSLLGKLPKAIVLIRDLQAMIKISVFLADAEKFTMKNLAIMTQFPLQIYGSALLFSPRKSVIKNAFFDERPSFISKFLGGMDHWDPCRQILDRDERTKALAFSPKNTCFASAMAPDRQNPVIKIWDTVVGDCIRTFHLKAAGDVMDEIHLSFLSESNLAVCYRGIACLIDVKSGTFSPTVRPSATKPFGRIDSPITCSPDGKSFAIAANCSVDLWDVSTWTRRRTLQGHSGSVTTITFAHDSKTLATGSEDGTIRVWNPIDGTCTNVMVIEGDFHYIHCLFFSVDNSTIISLSGRVTISLWDVSNGALKAERKKEDDQFAGYADCSLSSIGETLAIACSDGKIRFEDVTTGAQILVLNQEGHLFPRVKFSRDEHILISSTWDGSVRLWDISGPPAKSSSSHESKVTALRFSQEGQYLATGSEDGDVKLWNSADGLLEHTFDGHSHTVNFVVFAPDGRTFATIASDQKVRIWDSMSGICRHILTFRSSVATFSPDGKLLAVDAGLGRVLVWDVMTGECQRTIECDPCLILRLLFIREGKELIMQESHGVQLWDLATGTCKQRFANEMTDIFVSADEATLISASADFPLEDFNIHFTPDSLRVWDLATGVCRQIIRFGYRAMRLSFIDKYFETDREVFSFNSSILTRSPDSVLSRSGVEVKDTWVIRDGKKLFALPPDYPQNCTTVHGNTVALGGFSGEVAIVELADI